VERSEALKQAAAAHFGQAMPTMASNPYWMGFGMGMSGGMMEMPGAGEMPPQQPLATTTTTPHPPMMNPAATNSHGEHLEGNSIIPP
jgi:hypothetical protein